MPGEDKGKEGVDAAFAKIVEGLDFSMPADEPMPGDGPSSAAEPEQAEHTPEVALLLPGIDSGEAMAAICKLADIEAVCIPSDVGTIVCLTHAGHAAARASAAAFSAMLRTVPVVLLRRGKSDDPADSDVQAARYLAGEQQDRLAPGLLLAQAPDVIEALILGTLDPRTVDGSVDAASLSRLKATRILARLLRGFGRGRPGS